ncbi:PR5-like receptor kinase [Hibiscus syriacus]|uniref:PR5-like receptor kinase n=1 Tax=Hibiscus syriacus TaxID=106335 RepID=A0A6A3ASS3_HIBSY|nr:PR5-like receptor kinase [Hibiscus syriacus]
MAAFALVVFVFPGACLARHLNQDCGSVFCGSLNISYPLRLKNQPPHCGRYEVECEKNNRTALVLREGKFSVEDISYENYTMRVVDAGLDMDDCNSLPLSSVYNNYSHCEKPIGLHYYDYNLSLMYVVNCTKPIESALYIPASRCRINSNASSYFYFLHRTTLPSDFSRSCTVEAEVPIEVHNISGMSTLAIYNKLSEGVLLTWMTESYLKEYCTSNKVSFQDVLHDLQYALESALQNYADSFVHSLFNGPHVAPCIYASRRTSVLCVGGTVGLIMLRTLLGIICLVVLVIYKWRRSHLSADDKIEEFLQNHNLSPIRYSFKQIRK